MNLCQAGAKQPAGVVTDCRGTNPMNRLSLADLKAKANVVVNVEAIKGGSLDDCHGAVVTKPTSGQGH